MNKKQELLKWQPEAENICYAGYCHECNQDSMMFYQLPKLDKIAPLPGYVQGGFWCWNCKWGNSGAMPQEDFAPDLYS